MQNPFKISLDKISMVYKISFMHDTVNIDALDNQMNEYGFWMKEEFGSTRYGTYQKNYTYCKAEEPEGTIFLGFILNAPIPKTKYFKIEYNPNKVQLPVPVTSLINQLHCRLVKVQSIDVALDFEGLAIDDYRVDTRSDTMVYSSGINRTYYIRPNGEGRIKIYDKTKERAKLGIEIPQTLRVEMTIKDPDFFQYNLVHELYVQDISRYIGYLSEISVRRRTAVIPGDDRKYNPVILYLLNNVDQETAKTAISMMSVNHRAKYRDLMTHSEFERIDIDPITFLDTLTYMIRREVPVYEILDTREELTKWTSKHYTQNSIGTT